ncbi:hypothetical protein SODALDRAFT_143145 [Sodiomyces alkalinus F11]|uniref:Uncharacterized protein n=1 Tax=Sodiomyces alkalinus (strain CBS 110278 / VKM F-3762 / F11) TaxID=1314773 RepID=A0A3N2PZQ4_SODAK|nr:hypothetical protein SODALDRAFT_143145 [Sodiomyces alkalinus F11]ROT39994.1 hypothetical protein SODALDRAFT_143145 [Sodiomyces alkalinus F11]
MRPSKDVQCSMPFCNPPVVPASKRAIEMLAVEFGIWAVSPISSSGGSSHPYMMIHTYFSLPPCFTPAFLLLPIPGIFRASRGRADCQQGKLKISWKSSRSLPTKKVSAGLLRICIQSGRAVCMQGVGSGKGRLTSDGAMVGTRWERGGGIDLFSHEQGVVQVHT